jgi:dihydropteroate synthase
MAIVNATPDSFSDGGKLADTPAAAQFARECAQAGAAIIDIGGESTRPGAVRVPCQEQIRRTIPVIQALQQPPLAGAVISIDTTSALVARTAIQAGAHIVNDVSAGTDDPEMFAAAAEAGVGLVLMHRVAPPSADCYSHQHQVAPVYADVAAQVRDWLLARADIAERAGVARECIALDPGLGFGKNVEQNFLLVAQLERLTEMGYPVVVGASRKSFIGAVTGVQDPQLRCAGSIAVALAAVSRGASVLRVHDVAAHHQALAAWQACNGARSAH